MTCTGVLSKGTQKLKIINTLTGTEDVVEVREFQVD
jgi:hypothetical protein